VIIRKYQVQTGVDQDPKLPPTIMAAATKERKTITKNQLIAIFAVAVAILVGLLFLVWKHPDKIPILRNANAPGSAAVSF
jgi:hypothetical protein